MMSFSQRKYGKEEGHDSAVSRGLSSTENSHPLLSHQIIANNWQLDIQKKIKNVMFRLILLKKCSLFISDVKYSCLLKLNGDVRNRTDLFT